MWDELEIAPTDDARAIRRAYAARLKRIDADRDPAAFVRLRQAYGWALRFAERARQQAGPAAHVSPDVLAGLLKQAEDPAHETKDVYQDHHTEKFHDDAMEEVFHEAYDGEYE